MAFRKLARPNPVALTLKTISEYQSHLHSGLDAGSLDPWEPLFLRYYMQVYAARYPPASGTEIAHRELRTMADTLDAMLRGNISVALDLLSQHMKAVILATSEGNYNTARWLQLIPETSMQTISVGDEEVLRRIQAEELKLAELKRNAGVTP